MRNPQQPIAQLIRNTTPKSPNPFSNLLYLSSFTKPSHDLLDNKTNINKQSHDSRERMYIRRPLCRRKFPILTLLVPSCLSTPTKKSIARFHPLHSILPPLPFFTPLYSTLTSPSIVKRKGQGALHKES